MSLEVVVAEAQGTTDDRVLEYLELVQAEFSAVPWVSDIARLEGAEVHLLVEGDEALGGITLLEKCPEDSHVRKIYRDAFGEGGTFASCLFIKPDHRGEGSGTYLLRSVIKKCAAKGQPLWGVLDNEKPRLARFYAENFGATILRIDDELSLVRFTSLVQ